MANATWGRSDGSEEAATSAPPASVDGLTPHRFQFHGSGKEYFGIWIVNILLSIVTLGIYSAWAKVRTKRYFNGNTELAGHRFDYHAEPMQILKGRIVVVVVLIVLNLLSQLHPALALVLFAFYLIAVPWVIVRGLAFNANMTSYRNVRFHFANRKWNAFVAYILLPSIPVIVTILIIGVGFIAAGSSNSMAAVLLILPLGLIIGAILAIVLIPYLSRASARFLGNGHKFGQADFSADPPLRPYYRAIMICAAWIVIPIAIALFIGFGSALSGSTSAAEVGLIQLASVIAYIGILLGYTIYAAYARNNSIGHLQLQNGHRFESTVAPGRYTWITVSNLFFIVITLTLFTPWARVRMARYLADNTTMHAADDLDNFIGQQTQDTGVTSGEFLDIEGFDFGF